MFRLVQLLLVAAAATSPAFSKTIIIAHRGVANPFSDDDHGCSTKRLRHIRYPYIQGTRASLQAAWDAGADVVEVDLRVTKDRQVVVFHDEDVSCKTQGVGRVRDLTLTELKRLDLAFGLSADGGKTFPLRGSGRGSLLTLEEMWAAFPGKKFMLNPKDQDMEAFRVLRDRLRKLDLSAGYLYWGPGAGFAVLNRAFPGKGKFIPNHLQQEPCLGLLLEGIWFGHFPPACERRLIDLSPSHWEQPFMPLLLKLARQHGAEVALYATNRRQSFLGFMDSVEYLFTSEILETGRRETPWVTQTDEEESLRAIRERE